MAKKELLKKTLCRVEDAIFSLDAAEFIYLDDEPLCNYHRSLLNHLYRFYFKLSKICNETE